MSPGRCRRTRYAFAVGGSGFTTDSTVCTECKRPKTARSRCPLRTRTSRRQEHAVSPYIHGLPGWLHRERRGAAHYLLQCGLEMLHLVVCADGDANASGHDGPDAPDENILFGHRVDHFLAGTFGIQQEAVRL